MTNPYRAMCAELLEDLEIQLDELRFNNRLCIRARALLAQPAAEGPTDEELLRVAATAIAPYEISGITPGEYEPETECVVEAYGSELIAYARAALARFGRPTPQPVADGEVAELVEWLRESLDCALQSGNSKSIKNHCRLLDLLGRPTLQPVPEPVALTDEEIEEWADACSEAPLEEMDPEVHGWRRCFTAKEFSETIRAALARFGRPTPQPVAEDAPLSLVTNCQISGPAPKPFAYWSDYFNHVQQSGVISGLKIEATLPTPEATNG